ncbi:MAG: hypothetical protein HWN68_19570 [Desulfobacterales bacterium]|nr:hypothetical protein [Desulfobacterales bacterium]
MSEDEGYWCLYYPDLECPVQRRLKEFSFIDSIEPVKEDDAAKMARTMRSVMTASTFMLSCLASFCGSCPHLRRKTYEKATAEAGKLMSLGPAKAVPIPGRNVK